MKTSVRSQLIALIEHKAISEEKIDDALRATKVMPTGQAWIGFINHLLVWLGGLALSFAVLFFVAYNWQDIGRFAQFAMVEAAIVVAVLAYWKLGTESTAAKVSLLSATILLGVLLALYGQTYQTGADTWQLFFTWSLLILPWVIVGKFSAIWIVWILLLNVTIMLYQLTFQSLFWFALGTETAMLWTLFLFNTLVLVVWEILSGRYRWLSVRWAARLLALASGTSITWLVVYSIFGYHDASNLAGFVWSVWLAMLYFIYRKIKPDLFMLAGGCLTAVVVLVSFISKHMLKNGEPAVFLFVALIIIGMSTGIAMWLRSIHREWST